MRATVAVVLAALFLAGCGSPPATFGPPPELQFGAMVLETVPLEPFEVRGQIEVGWEGSLFAVQTKNEAGMPAKAVRDGETLYTTQSGLGWTAWDLDVYVRDQARGFRYLAWDARALLEEAEVTDRTEHGFTASSEFTAIAGSVEAELQVNHTGTSIQDLSIRTPADQESPYTLRPLGRPFPFTIEVPPVSRPSEEVAALDDQARQGHAAILGWIQAYQRQDPLGRLPSEPTPEALVAQRLGQPWPASPYDQQPMRDQHASGHFDWSRCSDTDASYIGLGWDGTPISRTFGRGCAS